MNPSHPRKPAGVAAAFQQPREGHKAESRAVGSWREASRRPLGHYNFTSGGLAPRAIDAFSVFELEVTARVTAGASSACVGLLARLRHHCDGATAGRRRSGRYDSAQMPSSWSARTLPGAHRRGHRAFPFRNSSPPDRSEMPGRKLDRALEVTWCSSCSAPHRTPALGQPRARGVRT